MGERHILRDRSEGHESDSPSMGVIDDRVTTLKDGPTDGFFPAFQPRMDANAREDRSESLGSALG